MSRPRRLPAARVAAAVLALPAFVVGCGSEPPPADPATVAAGGRVFNQAGCKTCHTLGAARSEGRIGPNLDELGPGADEVDEQVREGGDGMPAYAGRLSEEQIRAVSAYVAEVAGR